MVIVGKQKPQPACSVCHHSKSNHDREMGCMLNCACSEYRGGENAKREAQPGPPSPRAGRKNFFARPLSKRARRRLARELGSIGMSKQAVKARVNQIADWQDKSPAEKKKAWKAKHMFVQGGLPSLGRRS